jgi:hypothetical protein
MNGSLRAAPYPPGDRTAGANDLAEVICSGIKTSSTSFGYALLIGETPRCQREQFKVAARTTGPQT